MSLYQNNKKYIKITEYGKPKSKHFYIEELFIVEISALHVFNIWLKSYQNETKCKTYRVLNPTYVRYNFIAVFTV